MTAERKTAGERRDDVIAAAVVEFAKRGFEGTSTDAIARRAGISQPYLFRLFPNKKALFIAVAEHSFDRVRQAFAVAAEDLAGEAALEAMGEVYADLLRDRDELLVQMHCYAACADEEIGAVVRREYGRTWRQIQIASGADDEKLQAFFAMGMLMNVFVSMDATSHASDWVKACVPPGWLSDS